MFKTAFVLAGMSGLFFFANPYVVYSGIQAQQPVGTAFKMTPDPSNIWSWHHTVTVKPNTTVTVPVVIDFDKNGKMDTEYSFTRVLVTDLQGASTQP